MKIGIIGFCCLVAAAWVPGGLGQGVVENPKTPAYIDCRADGVTLYPGGNNVSTNQFQQPGNPLDQLLDQVQADSAHRYVVVMVRPASVKTFRTLRILLGKRPIEVTYDAVDANFKVHWEEAQRDLRLNPPAPVPARPERIKPSTALPVESTVEEPAPATNDLVTCSTAEATRLVAELSAKQKQIKDFQAILVEGPRRRSQVSFRCQDDRMRIEALPSPNGLNEQSTYYDGEFYWEQIGGLLIRNKSDSNPHRYSIFPSVDSLAPTNGRAKVEFKVNAQWLLIERRSRPLSGIDWDKWSQNPELSNRWAKAQATLAELAAKNGRPAPDLKTIREKTIADMKANADKENVSRFWIGRQDGFCYRVEGETTPGQFVTQKRFLDVKFNVGLPPDGFRPATDGKRILDASLSDPASVVEKRMAISKELMQRPVFRPTPRAVPTNKSPVFFECRTNQVFFIDKEDLDGQVAKALASLPPQAKAGNMQEFQKAMEGQKMGTATYAVDPNYLLVGVVSLKPRPGVAGDERADLEKADGNFRSALAKLDKQTRSIVFLVRDDSFDVFRRAKALAEKAGFDTSWELLDQAEPIKFGAGGTAVAPR